MSREILKLVQKIDSSTVDLQMVLQCAPVLAGLKVSNMLSVSRAFYPRILEVLKETDISCYLLRQTDEKVILLLYKEQELQQQLLEADTESIFKILRIHTVCGRRCFGFIQKALLRQSVYDKGFST